MNFTILEQGGDIMTLDLKAWESWAMNPIRPILRVALNC